MKKLVIATVVLPVLVAAVFPVRAAAAYDGFLTQLESQNGCIVDSGATPISGCTNSGVALNGARWVAVSPDGNDVYVASNDADAVAVFQRSTTTGALTQLQSPNGCLVDSAATPISGCTNTVVGGDGPDGLVVSPDGKHVYVANPGADTITAFSRDTSGTPSTNPNFGTLTQLPTGTTSSPGCYGDESSASAPLGSCTNVKAIADPSSITISQDGNFVYVAARGATDLTQGNSIAIFSRNGSTGALTQLAGTSGCIVDTNATDITGCNNSGVGLLGAQQVALSPDGQDAYVSAVDSDAVAAFSRNSLTGELTQLSGTNRCVSETGTGGSCVDGRALSDAHGVTISPDGNYLYVTANGSDAVSVFSRNPSTGAITQLSGVYGCIVNGPSTDIPNCDNTGRALNGAQRSVVSADGQNLYVSTQEGDSLAAFSRNAGSGRLALLSGPFSCIVNEPATDIFGCNNNGLAMDSNFGLALSPDDVFLYVASGNSHAVTAFSRQVAPVCSDSSPTVSPEGSAVLDLTCTDANGDIMMRYIDTYPTNGVLGDIDQDAGTVSYTPNPGAEHDSFGFRATDGMLTSNFASVNITIATQRPPTCDPISASANEGASIDIDLGCSDPDAGDTLTRSIVAPPSSGGTLGTIDQATGRVPFTPDNTAATSATFAFKASDGTLDSSTVSATIAINRRPVCSNASATVNEGEFSVIELNCTDANAGDKVTRAIQTLPANGAIAVGNPPAGTVAYSPNSGAAVSDSFTFNASDGTLTSSTATVAVSINRAPHCNNVNGAVNRGQTVAVPLSCTDANGDALTGSVVTPPTNGTVGAFQADSGNVTYTPKPGFTGTESFTYRVTDGSLNSDAATVNFTVVAAGTDSTAPPATSPPSTSLVQEPFVPPPFQPPSQGPAITVEKIKNKVRRSELKRISGRATYSGGVGRVEVALVRTIAGRLARLANKCELLSARGLFRRGLCTEPIFLPASGGDEWSFELGRGLSRGSYVLYSRAIGRDGRVGPTLDRQTFRVV